MINDRTRRIFAGAGHQQHGAGAGRHGGLFRRSAGHGDWELLAAGLPANVEARALAVHPHDHAVIYAGTQDGPYRTTDGGDHWRRVGFPDRGAVVWSIAFDPTNPKIMYAGVAPIGIYRSEDGGDTWKKLAGAKSPGHCEMGFPARVTRIAIDPARPDHIYAALEVSGVIRSADGGETWKDVSAPLIKLAELPHLKSRIGSEIDAEGMLDSHAITVSGASQGTIFLAVRMGLFRSDDRGASWHDMNIGRFSPLTYCRDVMVAPRDARVMYACLSPAARSKDGSLYRSEDAGQTWQRFDHGIKANATMMAVTAHPDDAAQVYCVSRCGQVFGTEDAGASWREYQLPRGVQDVYAVACA
jgi:photosystem II stability/assembly factor-like uncharacterized protein